MHKICAWMWCHLVVIHSTSTSCDLFICICLTTDRPASIDGDTGDLVKINCFQSQKNKCKLFHIMKINSLLKRIKERLFLVSNISNLFTLFPRNCNNALSSTEQGNKEIVVLGC